VSSAHVVPVRIYVAVFTALMLLTGVTIAVAFVDLGSGSLVVALAIACVKATLVVLYFMHVRWGDRLVWVLLPGAVLWLVILISITLSDYLSRGWTATGA
jgi:cytochrome c oxidase subunit 4